MLPRVSNAGPETGPDCVRGASTSHRRTIQGVFLGRPAGRHIIGRVTERELLERSVDEQRWLMLSGPAGSGKSTLIDALQNETREAAIRTVVVVRPLEFESLISFSTLSELVARINLDALELSETHLRVLQTFDAGQDHGPVRNALGALLKALQNNGPLVLILDDAQWIDRASAEVLSYVCKRVARNQAMIAAFRTDTPSMLEHLFVREHDVLRIELGKLSVLDLTSILLAEAPNLTPALAKNMAETAEGSPLRARELGRMARLGLSNALTPISGDPDLNPFSRVVSIMETTDIEVLYAASQLRNATTERLVHCMASAEANELCADTIAAAISRSIDAGLLHLQTDRLHCSHPLLGDALAGHLNAERRRSVHARLAAGLAAGAVLGAPRDKLEHARHLSLASVRFSDMECLTLFGGAFEAARNGSVVLALQLSYRAIAGRDLDDLPADEPIPDLVVDVQRFVANLEFRGDDPKAAANRLGAVGQRLGDDPRRNRIELDLAMLRSWSDSLHLGVAPYLRLLARTDLTADERAEASTQLAILVANTGNYEEAAEFATAGVEASRRELGQRLAEALSVSVAIDFLAGRGFDRNRLDEAASHESLENSLTIQCPPFTWRPFLLTWVDDPAAFAAFQIRREVLARRGSITAWLMAVSFEIRMLCHHGRRRDAEDLVEQSLDLGAFEPALALACAQLGAARWYAFSGDLRRANGVLTTVEQFFDTSGFRMGAIEAADIRISVFALEQDWAGVAEFGQLWLNRLLDADAGEVSVFPGFLDMAEAAGSLGDSAFWEQLSGLVNDAVTGNVDANERPDLAAMQRWVVAAEPGQPTVKRLQAASDASEMFRAVGDLFWAARADIVAGRLHRRARSRTAAAAAFQRARTTFDGIGALGWASSAEREMGRLAIIANKDNKALSPVQSQVAQLAATGGSNRDIATALFISEKTVESHLSSVFRKMGITRRAQLGVALVALKP